MYSLATPQALTHDLRFLEGPEMFIIHRPSGKVPKTFSNLRRLPCRLVKEIFPSRTTVQRRDRKFVLVLEFETDVLSLELALQYLLACVNEGKYADVETDEMWCDRILETYKVFGAEYGITRMVQSAATALRRLEAEERAERAADAKVEMERWKEQG